MNILRIMNVPRSYREPAPVVGRSECCSFDSWKGSQEIAERLKVMAVEQRSIILSEPESGAGKSHLVVAYMIHSFENDVILRAKIKYEHYENDGGHNVVREVADGFTKHKVMPELYHYTRADDLIELLIKSGFDSADNFQKARKYRCLCIDEFGRDLQGYGKDVLDDAPTMNRLIGSRIDDLKQIVIATPLTQKEFLAKYDGSLLRRLEDNGGEWIDLDIKTRYNKKR